MSIERELLERWLIDFGKIHPDVGLIKDTKELLAQPEQEPVAWMLIDKETGARIPKAYKPEHGVNKDRWELYPLHTTLPKREPLSDEEIVKLWANKSPANEFECVRLVEQAHGIGGGNE